MKIYIGNLPAISDKALKALFEPFGSVKGVRLLQSKKSLRPRFFGYVEMDRKEEGRAAIDELSSKMIDGNKIVILEVKSKN